MVREAAWWLVGMKKMVVPEPWARMTPPERLRMMMLLPCMWKARLLVPRASMVPEFSIKILLPWVIQMAVEPLVPVLVKVKSAAWTLTAAWFWSCSVEVLWMVPELVKVW